MDTSDQKYQIFNLKNQEFTFDVDMSKLPCGLNGALYFVEMDADGGVSRFPNNKAGAKYGTGYCDTQCPHDIKFINGEVRIWHHCFDLSTNGSYRLTSSVGHLRPATRTLVPVSTARAATRWTFGRPTPWARR